MNRRILVSDSIAEDGIAILRPKATVDVKTDLSQEGLIAIIGDYDALVVRSQTQVTKAIIEAGKKLQVIGRAGVGVDNIDVDAATQQGVIVVNAPLGNTVSTAEHTVALMMAMARNIPQAHAVLKSGIWRRNEFTGIELRNKTLGIIGLGKVGTEVARRAKGLEMRVIAYDPFVSSEHAQLLGMEMVSFEDVLREADFITVHTPLTPSTKALIGEKELEKAKPSVRIINVARGGIIDEEALYRAIEKGRVAGAAIDCFSKEPMEDSILFSSDRIIVTPHLGASTAEAQTGVAVDVAEQILAVLDGRPARYAVNLPFVAPETMSMVGPFLEVANYVGRLASQLAEGQWNNVSIRYEGEIANYDTNVPKAAIIGGLLESMSEERVNLVNANLVAASRGLKIEEQKRPYCENYSNLISLEVTTSAGKTLVAGTLMAKATHIVRINDYWVDLVPNGGYWLFSDHRDRPGLISAVSAVTGNADINISSMLVGRLQPRGQALMVLGLDEPLLDEHLRQILTIPDVYTARLIRL